MTAKDVWIKPTREQIVTALTEARYLVAIGWTQRQARAVIDGRDCFCIMGAVAEVCGTIRLSWPILWATDDAIPGQVVPGAWLRDAVTAVVAQAVPPRFGSIAAYNDQPSTSQADMVALFNTAISIARREVAA